MAVKPFLSVTLFDRTGATPIKQLINSFDKRFVDELRGSGSFSFTIPKEDSTDIAIGKIVKFSYGETSVDYVFAGVIESIRRSRTDTADTIQIGGRGVRAILESAVIYTSDRTFTAQTVGQIQKTLIDEAQSRSALEGITYTFTNTLDSNGASFTANETITIEEKIGTNLAEVADRHEELAIDIWVKPDLSVNYYIQRGTDTTIAANPVVLRVGESVVSYETTEEGPIRNAAVVAWSTENQIKTPDRAASIIANGRLETYLSLTNIPDTTTADLAIDRTLDNLDDPTVGGTIEITDDGPVPYINFEIGDWIYIADEEGARERYRVRSVSMSEEANGGLRIVPEIGNAKADLEERLRRLIARQEAKTAGGSADATAASIDLNGIGAVGGGGAAFDDATVLTYDPAFGKGTADVPALGPDPIDFTNATGTFLFPDDVIVITAYDNDNNPATPDIYVAVGITARAGTLTPTNNPSGVVPYDFPFRTDGLTYPVTAGGNNSLATYAHDLGGLLGFGTDVIIGPSSSAFTATNAVVRGTTNSISIGAYASNNSYVDASGRLIQFGTSGQVRWRDPATGATTLIYNGLGTNRHAWDESNKTLWTYATSLTGGPFYRFKAGDAAPVPLGDLGTGLSNTTAVSGLALYAGHGNLHLSNNSVAPAPQWNKSSGDTANFVSRNAVTGGISAPYRIAQNAHLWSYVQNTTTNTIWVQDYNPFTGTITSLNTGIIWRIAGVQVMQVGRIQAVSPTVVALFGVAREDQLFTGGSATAYRPFVYTYNGTSNSLLWYSTTISNTGVSEGSGLSNPVNISGTTWRWAIYNNTGAQLWQMELTFV